MTRVDKIRNDGGTDKAGAPVTKIRMFSSPPGPSGLRVDANYLDEPFTNLLQMEVASV